MANLHRAIQHEKETSTEIVRPQAHLQTVRHRLMCAFNVATAILGHKRVMTQFQRRLLRFPERKFRIGGLTRRYSGSILGNHYEHHAREQRCIRAWTCQMLLVNVAMFLMSQ